MLTRLRACRAGVDERLAVRRRRSLAGAGPIARAQPPDEGSNVAV